MHSENTNGLEEIYLNSHYFSHVQSPEGFVLAEGAESEQGRLIFRALYNLDTETRNHIHNVINLRTLAKKAQLRTGLLERRHPDSNSDNWAYLLVLADSPTKALANVTHLQVLKKFNPIPLARPEMVGEYFVYSNEAEGVETKLFLLIADVGPQFEGQLKKRRPL